jgi:apolipoprotein N-acyltransferase
VTSFLATLAAAALYALALPPFAASWLSWVALVPLCLALRGARPAAAAGLGAAFGAAATLAVVAWLIPTLTAHYQRSTALAVAFWLAIGATAVAPFTALAFAGFARARPVVPPALRPALFAVAWVAAELARTHLGLRSSWTFLGDSLAGSARLRQIADVCGVYGASALVALGSATLAEVAAALAARPVARAQRRAALLAAVVFAIALAGAVGYGEVRLARFARAEPGLRVAMVQANEAPELRWREASALRVLRRYARLTEAELAGGRLPDVVIWPENAIQISPLDPRYALSIDALVQRAPLLLGAPRTEASADSQRSYNSAWLLEAGRTPLVYDKRRLLPFAEKHVLGLGLGRSGRRDLEPGAFAAGDLPGLFRVGSDVLGLLICMEALYPSDARELARRGATVLVNLSNDGWARGRGAAEQHEDGAVFRAVETRLPMVRSTPTGVSAIVDARGERIAALPFARAGVLGHDVPAGDPEASLYVRIGDAFALGCAALWLAASLAGGLGGHGASSAG